METKKRSFENLVVWQDARYLVNHVYMMMSNCRDYGFRDQIQRASISIMNNIAEGADSGSDIKFRYFLNVARGSSSEVRSMLYLCEDLNICTHEHAEELRACSRRISASIINLIKSIASKSR